MGKNYSDARFNSITAPVPDYENNENDMSAQKGLEYFLYTYNKYMEDAFPYLFFSLGNLQFVLIESILTKSKLNTISSWKRILFCDTSFCL